MALIVMPGCEVDMEFKYFTDIDTESDVHKQYRKLAKKYHPDKAKNDEEREQFHLIMTEIGKEHSDLLVLINYNRLQPLRESNRDTKKANKKSFVKEGVKETIKLFALNNNQQAELINKGKDM